jgi:hypothetical protein
MAWLRIVLRCSREEVRDVGVVPKRDNPGFRDLVFEEMGRPKYTG